MKNRKLIHIVKHSPTGAEIPVIVKKVNADNIVEDFAEKTGNRKGFTIKMLEERWNKSKKDIINILQKYQIPAHLNHANIRELKDDQLPVDVAIFFEEYILSLELKAKIKHKKLKSIKIN